MELVIRVCGWAFAIVLSIILIVLQFLGLQYKESADLESVIGWTTARVADFSFVLLLRWGLFSFLLRCLNFCLRSLLVGMAAFLVFCPAWSLMVQRRTNAQSKQIQGLTRLLVVSIVLFIAVALQFSLFMVESRSPWLQFEGFFVPDWLKYGLDRILFHLLQSSCLFFIALMGSKQFVRQSVASSLNAQLLGNESEEEGGRNQDAVPLAYQI